MAIDVVVIGGGIIGACCAYELAKQGLSVCLVDKGHFGTGASANSAAMLELQIDAYRGEPFFSLARTSHDLFPPLYEEIKSLTGEDFRFERCGILQLALQAEEESWLQQEAARQRGKGLNAEWLDRQDVKTRLPSLGDGHFGGAFFAEDGQVDGRRFLTAMLKAAAAKGVQLRPNAGDLEIVVESSTVTGVRSRTEVMACRKVVLAAGCWSNDLLRNLHMKIDIEPVRGQLILYDAPKRTFAYPIYTKTGGYLTPKDDHTLVGTTVEYVGFKNSASTEGRQEILGKVSKLFPFLSTWNERQLIAGLRPKTPDNLPLLGPVGDYDSIVAATGHYRNGVLLAPVTSKIIADLTMDRPPSLDLEPFSTTRFLAKLS